MCRKMLTGVALLCLAGGAVLPVAAATGAACAPRGGLFRSAFERSCRKLKSPTSPTVPQLPSEVRPTLH